MFAIIAGLVKDGLGLLGDGLKNKREVNKAEAENTARLLRDAQSNNSRWEIAQLKQADKWSRRFVLVLFATPIIVTVTNPDRGKEIWENFNLVPTWFSASFVALCFATWGIRNLQQFAHFRMNKAQETGQ